MVRVRRESCGLATPRACLAGEKTDPRKEWWNRRGRGEIASWSLSQGLRHTCSPFSSATRPQPCDVSSCEWRNRASHSPPRPGGRVLAAKCASDDERLLIHACARAARCRARRRTSRARARTRSGGGARRGRCRGAAAERGERRYRVADQPERAAHHAHERARGAARRVGALHYITLHYIALYYAMSRDVHERAQAQKGELVHYITLH